MKAIPNYKGYYITTDGDVYSTKKSKLPVKMKSNIDTSNYYRITLITKPNEAKTLLVHRLVAITYIPNPDNLPQVNHKDGNKLNNNVDNLEWVTAGDNQRHAYDTGLKSVSGESNPRSILKEDQVLLIYNQLKEGRRVIDIAKEYGATTGMIGSIKDRTNWNYLLKDLPPIKMRSKQGKMSDDTVKWICRQLSSGVMPSKILKLCTNPKVSIDQIYDIKRRRGYKHIIKDFHW